MSDATMSPSVGTPLDRIDGPLKVTGAAKYSAEMPVENVAHAVMVTSTIPSGRIQRMDTAVAEAAGGVIRIFTPFNAPRLQGAQKPTGAAAGSAPTDNSGAKSPAGGQSGQSGESGQTSQSGKGGQSGGSTQRAQRIPTLLQDDRVHYNGQPIGVVVAATLEQAIAAALLVRVTYAAEKAELDMATGPHAPGDAVHPTGTEPRATSRGDVELGMREAAVRVDNVYSTPFENHNPLEPHNTLAAWDGDRLTLYDSTQGVFGVRGTVAKTFGVPAENVRVVSHFTGGGFGSKGGAWSHVMLAAMAAREIHRPVKLVVTRKQMFGPVGGRPRTSQRVALGAASDGKLTAIRHDCTSTTSMLEDWLEPSAMQTRILYDSPNAETDHSLVRLNVGSPTFMRAPGESTGTFALESAMDELAVRAQDGSGRVPLEELRGSRSGEWKHRGRASLCANAISVGCRSIRLVRDARRLRGPCATGNWLVGCGMATRRLIQHARALLPLSARLILRTARLRSRRHSGYRLGTYTIMTQIAADSLGLPVNQYASSLATRTAADAGVGGLA